MSAIRHLTVLLIVALPAFVEAACAGASPTWTSTADASSLTTCIANATSGDTITVAAGSFSGSFSANKSLHIQGAGVGSTTITGGFSFNPTVAEASKVFEVSGFTFVGNNALNANTPNATTPITSLKIHDNAFTNASVRSISLGGLEFGVVYSNTFSGNKISISIIGAGTAGWNYAHAFGSANYLYIENNTFGQGTDTFVTETGQGGRLAFRYNTISGYTCSGCEVHDVHGDQGDRGTVTSEYYHNTYSIGTNMRWFHHRGGQAIIANNTITQPNPGFNYTEYTSWSGNTGNPNNCGPYPAPDQITNTFYWNNTFAGTNRYPTFTNGDGGPCGAIHESVMIQLNRDYWRPTAGLAASRPGTCTADNNTYWGATDTDVLYKCTTTNVWTAFFTPFAYPHPLRAGVTAPPAAPSNLRISGLVP
jgi:hypothetical protein